MENEKPKSSNFMESAVKDMALLFQGGRATMNMDEVETGMEKLFRAKLKQSFKNGIEVGMKKAAFQKKTAQQKKGYRKQ